MTIGFFNLIILTVALFTHNAPAIAFSSSQPPKSTLSLKERVTNRIYSILSYIKNKIARTQATGAPEQETPQTESFSATELDQEFRLHEKAYNDCQDQQKNLKAVAKALCKRQKISCVKISYLETISAELAQKDPLIITYLQQLSSIPLTLENYEYKETAKRAERIVNYLLEYSFLFKSLKKLCNPELKKKITHENLYTLYNEFSYDELELLIKEMLFNQQERVKYLRDKHLYWPAPLAKLTDQQVQEIPLLMTFLKKFGDEISVATIPYCKATAEHSEHIQHYINDNREEFFSLKDYSDKQLKVKLAPDNLYNTYNELSPCELMLLIEKILLTPQEQLDSVIEQAKKSITNSPQHYSQRKIIPKLTNKQIQNDPLLIVYIASMNDYYGEHLKNYNLVTCKETKKRAEQIQHSIQKNKSLFSSLAFMSDAQLKAALNKDNLFTTYRQMTHQELGFLINELFLVGQERINYAKETYLNWTHSLKKLTVQEIQNDPLLMSYLEKVSDVSIKNNSRNCLESKERKEQIVTYIQTHRRNFPSLDTVPTNESPYYLNENSSALYEKLTSKELLVLIVELFFPQQERLSIIADWIARMSPYYPTIAVLTPDQVQKDLLLLNLIGQHSLKLNAPLESCSLMNNDIVYSQNKERLSCLYDYIINNRENFPTLKALNRVELKKQLVVEDFYTKLTYRELDSLFNYLFPIVPLIKKESPH